jgi:hypothetical protein
VSILNLFLEDNVGDLEFPLLLLLLLFGELGGGGLLLLLIG